MLFESVFALAAASVALAATPQGFLPASQSPLMVSYSGIDASGGKVVAKEVSAKQPQLATTARLTGTSYAVMMVDMDIPTNSPPTTSTLLHWMQTNLQQSSTATALNTTGGVANVFALRMPGAVAAAASYIGPGPPARTPLSHRYAQILIDTSSASQASMTTLMQAAQSRQGFNAEQVLTQAGLQDKVVAGNFFLVTNPGPASDTTTGATAASGNATAGTAKGSGTGTEPAKATTASPFRSTAVLAEANVILLGVAIIGAAFFSL